MSSRRKYRSRYSSRKKAKCKPISRRKICGPYKSCRYPHVYSRQQLIELAKKDLKDDFSLKEIQSSSIPQLCSHLGLTTREAVQFNRVLEGRKCGPEPEANNPNVWTKNQLVDYVYKNNIIPNKTKAKRLHREELCVIAADWAYQHKTEDKSYQLPEAPLDLYPVIKYKGTPSYVLPFIYSLLQRYPDLCFFSGHLNPNDKRLNYNAIRWNCATQEMIISPELIDQMKNCSKRFFVFLLSLRDPGEKKVGRHANFFLYDRKLQKVWHYEPLRAGIYHKCDLSDLFSSLEILFKQKVNSKIELIAAPSYCPKLNISRLIFKQKHKGFNPEGVASGLCLIINLWILDNKLAHPELTLDEVNRKAIQALHEHEYGMLNHILNWMSKYLQLRKDLKKEAGINNHRQFEDYMWKHINKIQKDRTKYNLDKKLKSPKRSRKN